MRISVWIVGEVSGHVDSNVDWDTMQMRQNTIKDIVLSRLFIITWNILKIERIQIYFIILQKTILISPEIQPSKSTKLTLSSIKSI